MALRSQEQAVPMCWQRWGSTASVPDSTLAGTGPSSTSPTHGSQPGVLITISGKRMLCRRRAPKRACAQAGFRAVAWDMRVVGLLP